jgi:hypothetical protein
MPIPKMKNEFEALQRVPGSIGGGTKTVTSAGTAVQLSATTITAIYCIISGKPTNTGYIYIGGSDVLAATGNGVPIAALQSVRIDIDDLSKVYIDAVTSTDGVNFTYVGP